MPSSQFLLIGLGEAGRIGGNVRLLGVADSEADATTRLDDLDPGVLGLIAVVEVKQQFERRPTVQSTPTEKALFATEKKKS